MLTNLPRGALRAWLAFLLCAAAVGARVMSAAPQETREVKNPVEGDPKAIEQGRHLYRGSCAVCHGLDARGYRATDFTSGDYVHGSSDAQLFRVISRGIPGTEMPGSTMHDDEVWMVVAYLRTLGGPEGSVAYPGNADNGERLYWQKGNCGQCHMIKGRGGRLGPDLSRIGAARSRAALVREIRTASEYFPLGYEPVTVVTRDGRRIKGCRKNEDTFSIQVMDASERLMTFMMDEVKEVIDDKVSLMPDYGPGALTDAELEDLLRYLSGLRGVTAATSFRSP